MRCDTRRAQGHLPQPPICTPLPLLSVLHQWQLLAHLGWQDRCVVVVHAPDVAQGLVRADGDEEADHKLIHHCRSTGQQHGEEVGFDSLSCSPLQQVCCVGWVKPLPWSAATNPPKMYKA